VAELGYINRVVGLLPTGRKGERKMVVDMTGIFAGAKSLNSFSSKDELDSFLLGMVDAMPAGFKKDIYIFPHGQEIWVSSVESDNSFHTFEAEALYYTTLAKPSVDGLALSKGDRIISEKMGWFACWHGGKGDSDIIEGLDVIEGRELGGNYSTLADVLEDFAEFSDIEEDKKEKYANCVAIKNEKISIDWSRIAETFNYEEFSAKDYLSEGGIVENEENQDAVEYLEIYFAKEEA
jgi:hypothetical protein